MIRAFVYGMLGLKANLLGLVLAAALSVWWSARRFSCWCGCSLNRRRRAFRALVSLVLLVGSSSLGVCAVPFGDGAGTSARG